MFHLSHQNSSRVMTRINITRSSKLRSYNNNPTHYPADVVRFTIKDQSIKYSVKTLSMFFILSVHFESVWLGIDFPQFLPNSCFNSLRGKGTL